MKKLISLFAAAVMLAASAFAETSAKYKELLAKAKQYEQNKQYVYALGTYYDALAEESTNLEAIEAYNGFNNLRTLILSGEPGVKIENEFTKHDSWKTLMAEYEKYWGEHIPLKFFIGPIKKGDVDFTTRTATYYTFLDWGTTQKYENITNILGKGYAATYREDWSDMPYIDEDLRRRINTEEDISIINYIKYCWPYESYLKASDIPASGEKNGALYADFFYDFLADGTKFYRTFDSPVLATTNGSRYNLKVEIVDENNNVLLRGDRNLLSITVAQEFGGYHGEHDLSKFYLAFKKVPQNIMEIIDGGKAKIRATGISLEYGILNSGDKPRTKPLSFSEVSVTNFTDTGLKNGNYYLEDKDFDPIKVFEKIKDESDRNNSLLTTLLPALNNEMEIVPGKSYKMKRNWVTEELYKTVMNENPVKDGNRIGNGGDYNSCNVSYYDAIYFCNLLSIKAGLEPAYSVNGETDVNKWHIETEETYSRTPYRKSLGGNINQNINASGFRLPSGEDTLSLKYSGWIYPPNRQHMIFASFRLVQNTSESEAQKKNNEVLAQTINKMVKINKIEVGATEVTQKQYQEIMGKNPSKFKGDYLPVENVSWIDAIEFCNKLSEKEGLQKCYSNGRWVYYNLRTGEEVTKEKYDKDHKKEKDEYKFDKYYTADCNPNANGYRLPTTEEWYSFAPEGSYRGTYYISNRKQVKTEEIGWTSKNSGETTHQVATKASARDLYDVIGNVAEWCNEQGGRRTFNNIGIYDDKSYEHAYCGSSYLNSGDSLYRSGGYKRIDFYSTDRKTSTIGFRVVRTVK